MANENFKKGLLFGTVAIFTIGLQPVIANSRPKIIDPYLFAAITALIEICFLLFFGVIISVTQASFNLLELNTGVIILLISVIIFTLVHTLTKSGFDRNELFPTQVVFIRNSFSGILLFSTYFLFFPFENMLIVIDPQYFIYFLLMGVDYGFSLFLWYKCITYLEIGKASVILSLTPIVSAFFSFILIGEEFTIFHLIGTFIIIFSIIIIVRQKK